MVRRHREARLAAFERKANDTGTETERLEGAMRFDVEGPRRQLDLVDSLHVDVATFAVNHRRKAAADVASKGRGRDVHGRKITDEHRERGVPRDRRIAQVDGLNRRAIGTQRGGGGTRAVERDAADVECGPIDDAEQRIEMSEGHRAWLQRAQFRVVSHGDRGHGDRDRRSAAIERHVTASSDRCGNVGSSTTADDERFSVLRHVCFACPAPRVPAAARGD